MRTFEPITLERVRRFGILILLVAFIWVFLYRPSDIYEIRVNDYVTDYRDRVADNHIDPLVTSLNDYISYKMKGAFTWSKREPKTIEMSGESSKFLQHILSTYRGNSMDSNIEKHRSLDSFWSNNSYYFRDSDLPQGFLDRLRDRDTNNLTTTDSSGEKSYFKLYDAKNPSSLRDIPVAIEHPLRIYSYMLLILSLLFYFMLPKPRIPEGAAYYTRFNAVYLPDLLGFSLWVGAWIPFFASDDSMPMAIRSFLLLFFAIFALAILLPTIKYASSWYLLDEDLLRWSDESGINTISTDDIVSIKPYKKVISKWVALLIVAFGRGKVGATGIGSLAASSTPEVGVQITTSKDKSIKIMANYLEADDNFTKMLEELKEGLER